MNESCKDLADKCISHKDNLELMRIPTVEEVKDVIWNLHPLKSLAPDGF